MRALDANRRQGRRCGGGSAQRTLRGESLSCHSRVSMHPRVPSHHMRMVRFDCGRCALSPRRCSHPAGRVSAHAAHVSDQRWRRRVVPRSSCVRAPPCHRTAFPFPWPWSAPLRCAPAAASAHPAADDEDKAEQHTDSGHTHAAETRHARHSNGPRNTTHSKAEQPRPAPSHKRESSK